jgi:hypothetical protein
MGHYAKELLDLEDRDEIAMNNTLAKLNEVGAAIKTASTFEDIMCIINLLAAAKVYAGSIRIRSSAESRENRPESR